MSRRLALGCAMLFALPAMAVEQALVMEVTPPREVLEDVVVAPIPISNPTLGTGLAVVVMPFYHLGEGSPLSNTVLAAGLLSSGTWGVGAQQSTRLRGDRMRIETSVARVWPDHYIETRVRLDGIDTPELKGRCVQERVLAERAKARLTAILAPGHVQLVDVHYGKYAGRVVARVLTADGRDAGRCLGLPGHQQLDALESGPEGAARLSHGSSALATSRP